jgi:hypothetical protein
MTGIVCAITGGGGYVFSTVVVTVGYAGAPFDFYGYSVTGPAFGSVSPSTWNTYSLDFLYYSVDGDRVLFAVGGDAPNSGWTAMTIDGTPFYRIDATYTNTPGASSWSWTGILTNPFGGTIGANKTVTWW